MKNLKLCLMGIVCFLTLAACSTSPTGRSQVLLYSDAQLAQMSEQAFTSMKSQIQISNKPVQNEYVTCIAEYITAKVPQRVFSGTWEIVVFDDNQANAFAMPGGKIGVYTGLLNVAKNQHQLAAVIGHEVAHVIAQHGNERMSRASMLQVGSQVANAALETYQVENRATIMQALGVGAQYFGILPFSREHESEADLIGLNLMAEAGFQPQESVQLWRNMSAASSGNAPPEWASTHPSSQTRISQLEAGMKVATTLFQNRSDRPNCG